MMKEDNMDLFYKHPNPIIRLFEYFRRRSIIKLVNYDNKTITDIGCERSPIVKEIIYKCKKVYCVDINPKFLRESKQRLNSKKAVFILSDAQKLRLNDNISEITICTDVLEHLPNPKQGLKELKRITKKDGNIIISVPNEEFLIFIKKTIKFLKLNIFFKGISLEKPENHLHIFNKKKILKLIGNEGLKVEKVFYHFPLFTTIFLKIKNTKD